MADTLVKAPRIRSRPITIWAPMFRRSTARSAAGFAAIHWKKSPRIQRDASR